MQATYPLARLAESKGRRRPSHLLDPVFRSNIVSIASCGISRRGVAHRAGIPPTTLYDWLERGRAQPDEEPYGSFTIDYLRAERGLEHAAAEGIAHWVVRVRSLAASGALLDSKTVGALLRILESRFPEDHGAHLHRKPELEPNGDAWLERNGMTHAQLVHLLREPPEAIGKALVEAGPEVMAMLIAAGVRVPA
mgnify:CR=1 FL=1